MTRKSIFISIILAALMIVLSSCTHMNGDIGDYFGRWNVISITADGVEQTLYTNGSNANDVLLYTWSFQGELIWILTLHPHQEYHTTRGMWRQSDNRLLLDFSFSDDNGTEYYTPPTALHMVENGVTDLEILSQSSSEMTLRRTADDGITYVYYLKKAY